MGKNSRNAMASINLRGNLASKIMVSRNLRGNLASKIMVDKTLKFRDYLVPLVLSGEKDVTWRINDEKDIQIGDTVALINWNTNEIFGKAKIDNVIEKKIADIRESDWQGHERFKDHDEMLATYRKYYGDWVDENTPIKMIKFELI